jgi:ribonuclease HII
MRALSKRHPHYRWETNMGYGTAEHHTGLEAFGITSHHRKSFTVVSQLRLDFSVSDDLVDQAMDDVSIVDAG